MGILLSIIRSVIFSKNFCQLLSGFYQLLSIMNFTLDFWRKYVKRYSLDTQINLHYIFARFSPNDFLEVSTVKKGSATLLNENGAKLHTLHIDEAEERSNIDERTGRIFSPKRGDSKQNFEELLKELRAPLGDLIKQRVGWTDRAGKERVIEYVEWHTVADILDRLAPEWSYSIRGLQQVGDLIAVTAAITINGVTREGVGTGTAGSETGIKKAESDALKRAARMFGVGRDLYKDLDEDEANSRQTQPTMSSSATGSAANERQTSGQQQGFAFDPLAHSTEDMVTPRQLVAIRAIANSIGVEAEAECQRMFKCDIKEISRRAASAFIDHLKARASSPRS
jgi:hypothetical protein